MSHHRLLKKDSFLKRIQNLMWLMWILVIHKVSISRRLGDMKLKFHIWGSFRGKKVLTLCSAYFKGQIFCEIYKKIKPFRCLLSPFVSPFKDLYIFFVFYVFYDFEHTKSYANAEPTLMELTLMLSIHISILHFCWAYRISSPKMKNNIFFSVPQVAYPKRLCGLKIMKIQ